MTRLRYLLAIAPVCVCVGCDGGSAVDLAVPEALLEASAEVAPPGEYVFYGTADGYPRGSDEMRGGVLVICGPKEPDAGPRLVAATHPPAFRGIRERFASRMMVAGQALFTDTVAVTLADGSVIMLERLRHAHGQSTPADSLIRLCVSDLRAVPGSVLLAGRELDIPGDGVVRLRFTADSAR